MQIADRLRALREEKKLSQGDIEKRTGLLRRYISRVENGHTVPAIETLEKMARALQVSMYQFFYDGEKRPTSQSQSRTLVRIGPPAAKALAISPSCVARSVERVNLIGSYCCTLPPN